MASTGTLKHAGGFCAQYAIGLLEREAVMPGGYRCVRGKDALFPHPRVFGFARLGEASSRECPPDERNSKQRSVAFVHMVDGGLESKRKKDTGTADAENGLLLEAIVIVAAIEAVGQLPVFYAIFRQVGIEQIDRNDVPGDTFDGVAERTYVYRATFNLDDDPGCLFSGVFLDRPGLLGFGLFPFRAEDLAEVSATVSKRDSDEREKYATGVWASLVACG
jgi:hypothetical protein